MRNVLGRITLAALSASLCLTVFGCAQPTSMSSNDDFSMIFMPMASVIEEPEQTEEAISPVQEESEPEPIEIGETESENIKSVPVKDEFLLDEFEPVDLEETVSDETEDQIVYEEPTVIETITYTIDEINKTVYTITNVDVRSGPADYCDVVGMLMSGTEVAVSGVCEETGWYRTSYNGSYAYFDPDCTADAVTSAQPKNESQTAETTAAETTESAPSSSVTSEPEVTESYVSGGFPLWNYSWHSNDYLGRLRIPSVGVDVAIYNNNAQSTIDAVDSAMFTYEFDKEDNVYSENNTIYCGDHNNQGFVKIANCSIGDAMYIDGVDGNTYKYICDRIEYNGVNTGWGLNDSTGTSMNRYGGVWCYTCHDDSDYYIYMVHFVPV